MSDQDFSLDVSKTKKKKKKSWKPVETFYKMGPRHIFFILCEEQRQAWDIYTGQMALFFIVACVS